VFQVYAILVVLFAALLVTYYLVLLVYLDIDRFVLLRLVYMMAVRWLIVLFRMIGIFFGLIAFEHLGILVVVCFVAVCVFLLSISLIRLRCLLHLGRGGGGRLYAVRILLSLLVDLNFHLIPNWYLVMYGGDLVFFS